MNTCFLAGVFCAEKKETISNRIGKHPFYTCIKGKSRQISFRERKYTKNIRKLKYTITTCVFLAFFTIDEIDSENYKKVTKKFENSFFEKRVRVEEFMEEVLAK